MMKTTLGRPARSPGGLLVAAWALGTCAQKNKALAARIAGTRIARWRKKRTHRRQRCANDQEREKHARGDEPGECVPENMQDPPGRRKSKAVALVRCHSSVREGRALARAARAPRACFGRRRSARSAVDALFADKFLEERSGKLYVLARGAAYHDLSHLAAIVVQILCG